MGHVSDFNGMNACDENDLSQVGSQLISDNNLLDLNLNENFMPIYNSFPDDIYQQPNLYSSSNLSSFGTDENRNNYFDDNLELDLFFRADNFNLTLDDSVPILANEDVQHLQNNENCDLNIETSVDEKVEPVTNFSKVAEGNCPTYQEVKVTQAHPLNEDRNEIDSGNGDLFESAHTTETTYSAETILKNNESEGECDPIPKLIIRLKPDSKVSEPDLCTSELSAPLTIADSVKLGKRRNGSLKADDTEQSISKKVKHKSHKHKSKHKKKSKHRDHDKSQDFSSKIQQDSGCFGENLCLNQNGTVNNENKLSETYDIFSKDGSNVNYQTPNHNSFSLNKPSPFVNTDFYSCNSEKITNNFQSETTNTEPRDVDVNKVVSEQSEEVASEDSFQFDFDDANILLSPSDIKKEIDSSVEEFLDDIDIPQVETNIPDSNECLTEDEASAKVESSPENSLSNNIKEEFDISVKEEETEENNEPVKECSASDLIEELKAHHQQVFEEIEISTPELELELNQAKKSVERSPEASHSSQLSATTISSPSLAELQKNKSNSQNHLSSHETITSTFHSTVSHNGTARPRNISSSSSSVTSKSSTSHRSYRKRRRSRSSSSSSSDRERFYNRPVKYDPVTDTYCDEFGREIRPNELKYYLNSKSYRWDPHSNNGSSASSLGHSKSPRYKGHHRKPRRSRSGSRSRRRRRHSSSRSRSRSHGRKHNGDSRKYRSPTPKHRSKRQHFMDVEENVKAYEERRVMYVGDIPPDYTVDQLKERFSRFGPIQSASIKSKFTNDGSLYIFGFVTFKNRADVCEAIERGNENPSWPRFDLNFGGRRRFCNGNYTDLDGKVAEAESGWYSHQSYYRPQPVKKEDDFAELLRQEQRRINLLKK